MTEFRSNHVSVSQCFIHPVKSLRAIAVQSITIDHLGVSNDRRWMIVDAQGKFISQREHPRCAQIETSLSDTHLTLSHDQQKPISIPIRADYTQQRSVRVWKDTLEAMDVGDQAAIWLSSLLNHPVRLVIWGSCSQRLTDLDYANEPVSFADGYPILVVNQSSLDALNHELQSKLELERFRPNMVLSGLPAFAEDHLSSISCDGVSINLVKPCARCSIPGLDPKTGQRSVDPMGWLKDNRWDPSIRGATFGVNGVISSGVGQTIRTGARVTLTYRNP